MAGNILCLLEWRVTFPVYASIDRGKLKSGPGRIEKKNMSFGSWWGKHLCFRASLRLYNFFFSVMSAFKFALVSRGEVHLFICLFINQQIFTQYLQSIGQHQCSWDEKWKTRSYSQGIHRACVHRAYGQSQMVQLTMQRWLLWGGCALWVEAGITQSNPVWVAAQKPTRKNRCLGLS